MNFFSLFCVIIGSLFTSQFSIVENDSSAVTYIDSEDKKAFNSDVSNNDAQKLAQSIEFKVYKIDETSSSESVYESPAGICQDLRLQEV